MSSSKGGKWRFKNALNEHLTLHFVGSEEKWYFPEEIHFLESRDLYSRASNFKLEFRFQFSLACWIADGKSEKFNLVPISLFLAWNIPGNSY